MAVAGLHISDAVTTFRVLCGSFTGKGSRTMVASVLGPANVGMLYWIAFRDDGSAWQFLLKQRRAATLSDAGSDLRETVEIYRAHDARCCPSGGTKARVWHWDGARLAPGPWRQLTWPSVAEFFSPSGNIGCEMTDNAKNGASVGCLVFHPPFHSVRMGLSGRLQVCRGNRCQGNLGEYPDRLAYGRDTRVGRFRCRSLRTGMECIVIASGKGFLIDRDGVHPIGG